MNELQKQITALNDKVDALYGVIEILNKSVSESLALQPNRAISMGKELHHKKDRLDFSSYTAPNYYTDEGLVHKDVLTDVNTQDKNFYQGSETNLAPEIQVQRLTAQLTAAYNRIAALEEQLLARMVH
jgi:hypothetical protein